MWCNPLGRADPAARGYSQVTDTKPRDKNGTIATGTTASLPFLASAGLAPLSVAAAVRGLLESRPAAEHTSGALRRALAHRELRLLLALEATGQLGRASFETGGHRVRERVPGAQSRYHGLSARRGGHRVRKLANRQWTTHWSSARIALGSSTDAAAGLPGTPTIGSILLEERTSWK